MKKEEKPKVPTVPKSPKRTKPPGSGRQKGTPNKTTAELRNIITGFVGNELDNLFDSYKDLPVEDKINFIKAILPYAIPKQTENKLALDDATNKALKAMAESSEKINNIFS